MLIGRLSSSATTVATRNGQNLDYIIFICSTYILPALKGGRGRDKVEIKVQVGKQMDDLHYEKWGSFILWPPTL